MTYPDDALIALAVSTREHWLQRPMTPVERAAIEYQEMVRQQKVIEHQMWRDNLSPFERRRLGI